MRSFPRKFDQKKLVGEREALLTGGNPKLEKGLKTQGYLGWLMHLAPARLSGQEVCPWRSPGCTAACLNLSGRGGLDAKIQAARIRRTKWFLEDPDSFIETLITQIGRARKYTATFGLEMSMRLNGTSDIAWEQVAPDIFGAHRGLQFYDYTKGIERLFWARPKNYCLTFSRSETNLDEAREALKVANVATVYLVGRGHDLPARDPDLGVRVIDGDVDDLRFLDRPRRGVVVGLRLKRLKDSKSRRREAVGIQSGFVRPNPAVGAPDLEAENTMADVYAASQVAFDPRTGEAIDVR